MISVTKKLLASAFVTGSLLSLVTAAVVHAAANPVYSSMADPISNYLESKGALPATTVYDHWDMTCTAGACNNVPTESDYKSWLDQSVAKFRDDHTILFDFEKIVVNASGTNKEKAQRSVDQIKIFIGWTRKYYPNAKIGTYDYDWAKNYDNSEMNQIRGQLFGAGGFDMFNPTMYQRWDTQADWDNNLSLAIAHDREISNKPIIPYISPYRGGRFSDGLLSEDEWKYELTAADTKVNGSVVWTQSDSPAGTPSDQWVVALVDHLQARP